MPSEDPFNATFEIPLSIMNASYPWDTVTNSWSQCYRYKETFDGNNKAIEKCQSYVYNTSLYTSTTTSDVSFYKLLLKDFQVYK